MVSEGRKSKLIRKRFQLDVGMFMYLNGVCEE